MERAEEIDCETDKSGKGRRKGIDTLKHPRERSQVKTCRKRVKSGRGVGGYMGVDGLGSHWKRQNKECGTDRSGRVRGKGIDGLKYHVKVQK